MLLAVLKHELLKDRDYALSTSVATEPCSGCNDAVGINEMHLNISFVHSECRQYMISNCYLFFMKIKQYYH
jgi:hypothetical protein